MECGAVGSLTDEQLVARFVALAIAQDRAASQDETEVCDRLYDALEAIKQELKSRPGDRRHALIACLGHENAHVRYEAAMATLSIAPEPARAVLRAFSNWPRAQHASLAREVINALDAGVYVPG